MIDIASASCSLVAMTVDRWNYQRFAQEANDRVMYPHGGQSFDHDDARFIASPPPTIVLPRVEMQAIPEAWCLVFEATGALDTKIDVYEVGYTREGWPLFDSPELAANPERLRTACATAYGRPKHDRWVEMMVEMSIRAALHSEHAEALRSD